MICDKCGGRGFTKEGTPTTDGTIIQEMNCPKCRGKKELDWIENIIGVEPGIPEYEIFFKPTMAAEKIKMNIVIDSTEEWVDEDINPIKSNGDLKIWGQKTLKK